MPKSLPKRVKIDFLATKKLSNLLYIKHFESFKFQTGTIYICTIELISKNFNFKKINTMNNRQEIERVSRSCRFYFLKNGDEKM